MPRSFPAGGQTVCVSGGSASLRELSRCVHLAQAVNMAHGCELPVYSSCVFQSSVCLSEQRSGMACGLHVKRVRFQIKKLSCAHRDFSSMDRYSCPAKWLSQVYSLRPFLFLSIKSGIPHPPKRVPTLKHPNMPTFHNFCFFCYNTV